MRTTIEVKKELDFVESELNRINDELNKDITLTNKPFIFKSGKPHEGWTFHDALTAYVSKKLSLKWVLCSNS